VRDHGVTASLAFHSGHPWPSPCGQLALCKPAVLPDGRAQGALLQGCVAHDVCGTNRSATEFMQ
jgi:hypothetical protein